jgi:hypothetical protein
VCRMNNASSQLKTGISGHMSPTFGADKLDSRAEFGQQRGKRRGI